MTPTYNAQVNCTGRTWHYFTMHGDAQSPDAILCRSRRWRLRHARSPAAPARRLAGRDGFIQVLCTQVSPTASSSPKFPILDPHTGRELSHLTS